MYVSTDVFRVRYQPPLERLPTVLWPTSAGGDVTVSPSVVSGVSTVIGTIQENRTIEVSL